MPTAAPLYESSLPCPVCSRDVDLTNVKPGGRTNCPHCYKERGERVNVRRRQRPPVWKAEVATTEAAAIAADPVTRWDSEEPGALDWRGQLGPECPEAQRCDDHCPCSSPPIRWTADHTGTVCPECGPGCWEPSPGADARGSDHAKANATVARVARTPAAQVELDRKAREFERQRARILDHIDRQLAMPRLTLDSSSDLRWYRAQVADAPGPGRLAQLVTQLRAEVWETEPVPLRDRVRGWFRGEADDQDDEPDDYDDEPDQDDEDEQDSPAAVVVQLRPVPGYIAPERGPIPDDWMAAWDREATARARQQIRAVSQRPGG